MKSFRNFIISDTFLWFPVFFPFRCRLTTPSYLLPGKTLDDRVVNVSIISKVDQLCSMVHYSMRAIEYAGETSIITMTIFQKWLSYLAFQARGHIANHMRETRAKT
jgi:hypothetical protein